MRLQPGLHQNHAEGAYSAPIPLAVLDAALRGTEGKTEGEGRKGKEGGGEGKGRNTPCSCFSLHPKKAKSYISSSVHRHRVISSSFSLML